MVTRHNDSGARFCSWRVGIVACGVVVVVAVAMLFAPVHADVYAVVFIGIDRVDPVEGQSAIAENTFVNRRFQFVVTMAYADGVLPVIGDFARHYDTRLPVCSIGFSLIEFTESINRHNECAQRVRTDCQLAIQQKMAVMKAVIVWIKARRGKAFGAAVA